MADFYYFLWPKRRLFSEKGDLFDRYGVRIVHIVEGHKFVFTYDNECITL